MDHLQTLGGLSKIVAINENTAADHTLVTALPGVSIVVYYVWIQSGATGQDLTWKSGSNAISGVISIAANTEWEFKNSGAPVLQTNVGEALVLTLGAAQDIDGWLIYMERIDR